ncbi:MAG: CAP domain-containing protein [Microbacteriaceae bacterium]
MFFRTVARAMRGASRVVLIAVLGGLLVSTVDMNSASASTSALPSRYVAVGPSRLADTRGAGAFGFKRLDASTVRVQVAGVGGVPADASAAALTVTATDALAAGFVTVYPTGSARELTSNVNFNGPGEIVANGAIVALGTGGSVDIFVAGGAGIVVDVSGAFTPANGSTSAGRFQPAAGGAVRVLDTRDSGAPLPAGGTMRISRPSFVPSDAMAVVVNIAIDQSGGAGFLTAWPAGRGRPTTSVLNTERRMQTRSAMSIVPVSSAGFDVYSMSGGHIIVDVAGYFTGASAPAGSDGLFVPVSPTRILDTRGASPLGNGTALQPGWTVEVAPPVTGSALVYNLATTDARAPGYITAYPAGGTRGLSANVNAIGPGTAVANLAVTATSTRGVALYSFAGEHVVADLTGYFTGSPTSAPNAPPVNQAPATPTPVPPAGCEAQGLSRLNSVRAANGAAAVADDAAALAFACSWSAQMAASGNFAHSPGSSRTDAVGGCGNGENIAAGSLSYDLFDLWVNSAPHFANMVNGSYTHAAIGFVTAPNGTRYGTMVLVTRC